MALGSDKKGLKSSINVSAGAAAKKSSTTYTAARKFFAPDQVQSYDTNDLSTTSNSEHIIDQAGTLDSMSKTALPAAAAARAAVAAARSQIAAVPATPVVVKNSPTSFTPEDVANAQKNGVAALLASIGAISARIAKSVPSLVKNSVGTYLPPAVQPNTNSTTNPNTPDVDSISVEMNSKKGSITCFYSRLVFSLAQPAVAGGSIAAVRIFRTEVINPALSRILPRISIHGVDRMQSKYLRTRIVNDCSVDQIQSNLEQGNVDNSYTALIPFSPLARSRTAASTSSRLLNVRHPSSIKPTGAGSATADLAPYVYPDGLLQLDSSVAKDLNTLHNIQVQNPFLLTAAAKSQISVGKNLVTDPDTGLQNVRQSQATQGNGSPNVTTAANAQNFREVAVLTPSKLQSKTFPNHVQFTFEDTNVSFGRAYQYYLTTVDENMQESTRSQIVGIVIEGLRVPPPPSSVSANVISDRVSLGVQVDDQLVEKFEIYRQEVGSVYPVSNASFRSVSGANGYTSEVTGSLLAPNGYVQVGECLNAPGRGGSSFYDTTVRMGKTYSYRVYSTDIFGNKSESPKQVSIFVPEPTNFKVQLTAPVLTAEVDATTGLMRLTFECFDSRVVAFFLGRRDLTIRQSAFLPPMEAEHIKWGTGDAARGNSAFDDPRINDLVGDFIWPQSGYFQNSQQEMSFIDRTVIQDHVYQYQLHGVDRFGNVTSYVNSARLSLVNRPALNPPTNLSANVQFATSGEVAGIVMKWEDPNVQYSTEDLVGQQTSPGGLRDTSVRNLYGVERKLSGEEVWHAFSAQVSSSFFDSTVVIDRTYSYRVQVFQTGSSISNYCIPVKISVAQPILSPVNFRLKMNDSKVRPFYVMLNWDNPPISAYADQWEIQRAECNNVAAARLNLRNAADFGNLVYQTFKTVYAESNTGQAASALAISGELSSVGQISQTTTITGQNCYMDTAVSFGNSYFYRIRSIDRNGNFSNWVYRGAKVTDASFEKKLNSILTDAERQLLSTNFVPLVLKGNMLASPDSLPAGSFSFIPDGSKSIVIPAVQLTNPSVALAANPPAISTPTSPSLNTFVNRSFRPTNDPNALAGATTPVTLEDFVSLGR